jgi:DNA-binding NarL/FixJ family response regulator
MRVLIVDDHFIIRRGLAQVLMDLPGVEAVAEAADGPTALQMLRQSGRQAQTSFDLVLLDIALGERDGLDVLKSVRAEFPRLGVVMLSVYPESQFAVRAIRSGAGAYLNKGCTPEELATAMRKVATGGVYVSATTAELLAHNVRSDASQAPHESLSNREFQVLQLLVSGHSVGEIAHQLSLSSNTISTYRSRLFDKLGVRSIVELMNYAARQQMLAP